jgi:DNA-binding GntR family transcriptional regulator
METSKDRANEYRTKRDVAKDHLRSAILSGEIPVGTWLRQQAIAETLGLSVTPVREAVMQLQSEGLLRLEPHRGVRVADLNVEDAEQLYRIRRALEPLGASEAAKYIGPSELARLDELQAQLEGLKAADTANEMLEINREIHLTIYRASRMNLLVDIVLGLWARSPLDILTVVPGRAAQSVDEHAQLVKALRDRDSRRAASLMDRHLARSGKRLIATIKSPHQREA